MSSSPSTLLRRLDPRLKLILLPLLIAATFSADSVARLLLLSVTALWLSRSEGETLLFWRRVVRPLRVLLLVTLLTHLCFSSGWTLFGRTWLSLDGLQLGLLTCWRLIVAVMYAVLLSLTTPAEELAAALGVLLSPLQKLRIRVDALTEFLFLTLAFIPILQNEAGEQLKPEQSSRKKLPLQERLRHMLTRIEPLILGFADHAEGLAARMAQGERVIAVPRPGPLEPPPGGLLTMVAGVLFILLLFAL